jgi:hypothetical protein
VKTRAILFSGALLSLWLGCSSAPQADSTESVRQAVEKHLAARTDINPANMRVTVDKVEYEADRAQATVTIAARNDPQAKMQMMYRLRKAGQVWEVEPQASGSGGHGAPPAPEAGEGGGALPPGHPGIGTDEANELPPGHPPVGEQPSNKGPGSGA